MTWMNPGINAIPVRTPPIIMRTPMPLTLTPVLGRKALHGWMILPGTKVVVSLSPGMGPSRPKPKGSRRASTVVTSTTPKAWTIITARMTATEPTTSMRATPRKCSGTGSGFPLL